MESHPPVLPPALLTASSHFGVYKSGFGQQNRCCQTLFSNNIQQRFVPLICIKQFNLMQREKVNELIRTGNC